MLARAVVSGDLFPAHLQAELTAKRDKLQGEREFLKSHSANLLQNQQDWKDMLSTEKCKVIERDAELASLKEQVTLHAAAEPATCCASSLQRPSPGSSSKFNGCMLQVRDLMVFLDVQQQVQQQGGGDLEGGTVLPVPEQPQPARRRGRGRGR